MQSRRFLSNLLLAALFVSMPLHSGCSSSSSSAVTLAAINPLCEFTPLGPTGLIRVPFWRKHLKDSAADFDFTIELDAPAGPDGATIDYALNGTAIDGVHYLALSPNPIVFAAGATQATVSVDLIPSGQFFHERSLMLELGQATGVTLHEKSHRAELWIRPAVEPPVLSVGATTYQVNAGGQANIALSLSQTSQEPVSLHYSVDAASDLTDYVFMPSGNVVFAPGQTSVMLPVDFGAAAASGSQLVLNLNHERNGVRYTLPAVDQDLTSNTDLSEQSIHLDENMWTFSVGGVQEFEHDEARHVPTTGWAMPGSPTDNIPGGSFWEPGKEDQQLVDLLPQTDLDPIVDPFSGVPLKLYSIADAATGVVPYLRKSFSATFCGSTPQLYSLPEYARISYYIAFPKGPDAARAVPFVRVGIRMRTLNLNHSIVFRIGSDGFDSDGNPVPVVTTTMGDIGVWDLGAIDLTTDKFGVVEDAHGVRFWHAHRLDANFAWPDPNGGADVFEIPGQVAGNPIEYPTWLSTGDGSLNSMGLPDVDAATGMGNLPYGFFWEISDDDSIFNDTLKPYFPKRANFWEPQGNAVLTATTSLTFTVM
ncbi:MAG: hypothetical protein ACI9X4_000435 [Glaciecola sp.]|jgi:hypothetical protein